MVTITEENGNVVFLNEKEFLSMCFNPTEKTFEAVPIQRTASIGIIKQDIELENVTLVNYANDAHPVSLMFGNNHPEQ